MLSNSASTSPRSAGGRDGEIARFARFLALLGLKATPKEYKCYDEATLAAMFTFAKQRMDQIQGVDHLGVRGRRVMAKIALRKDETGKLAGLTEADCRRVRALQAQVGEPAVRRNDLIRASLSAQPEVSSPALQDARRRLR